MKYIQQIKACMIEPISALLKSYFVHVSFVYYKASYVFWKIKSICVYSSVSEAWKVCVYVNGGASAIEDV